MVVGLGRCSWGCNDNFGWVVPIIEEDDDDDVEAPVVVALGVVLVVVVVVVVVDVMGGLGNVVVTDVGDEVVNNGSCNFLGDVRVVVVRVACGFVGVVVVVYLPLVLLVFVLRR